MFLLEKAEFRDLYEWTKWHTSICLQDGEQYSTKAQDSLKVSSVLNISSKCICNILTHEPGFHGDAWLPHQPTHKARKHLCLRKQRKNGNSLGENREGDWGKNGGCIEEDTKGADKSPHVFNNFLFQCPNTDCKLTTLSSVLLRRQLTVTEQRVPWIQTFAYICCPPCFAWQM